MPNTPVANLLRRAQTLDERGFTRAALDLVELQLREAPDEGRLWEMLGLLLAKQRKFAAAAEAFEQASLLVPLEIPTLVAWAECYLSADDQHAAGLHLEFLWEQPGLPKEILPRLASGFSRIGQPCRAIEVCREAVRRQPDSDTALFGLAYYMSQAGYPAHRVLPLLRRAIHLAPNCCLYRLTLVRLLDQLGSHTQAYETLLPIPLTQLSQLRCACCLQRLLDLCVEQEDFARSQVLAERLAELGSEQRPCS